MRGCPGSTGGQSTAQSCVTWWVLWGGSHAQGPHHRWEDRSQSELTQPWALPEPHLLPGAKAGCPAPPALWGATSFSAWLMASSQGKER